MVPEAAAEVSEMLTATSERRVTGRTDAPAPEVPMPTQKTGQRLVTALLSWWPIYTPHPDHFIVAEDHRDTIHIEEHLQANPSAY